MYVCMYVRMYVSVCMHTCVCACVDIFLSLSLSACLCLCVCVCVCLLCVCVFVCLSVCLFLGLPLITRGFTSLNCVTKYHSVSVSRQSARDFPSSCRQNVSHATPVSMETALFSQRLRGDAGSRGDGAWDYAIEMDT